MISFYFVGLVGDKGINELIAAFRKISGPEESELCWLVFETELDPLEQKTIEEINSNTDIISVFPKDVRPYFAISHCLTFPVIVRVFPMWSCKPERWNCQV
jgi:hypothetical protein